MRITCLKIVIISFLIIQTTFSFCLSSQTTYEIKKIIRLGMYEEAISQLENIILDKPDNWEAHFLLGEVFLLIGEEDNAFESFDRAINVQRRNLKKLAVSYLELGSQYAFEFGELELAQKIFDYAVEIESKNKLDIAELLLKEGERISQTEGYYAPKLFGLALNYIEDQEKKFALNL